MSEEDTGNGPDHHGPFDPIDVMRENLATGRAFFYQKLFFNHLYSIFMINVNCETEYS